MNRGPGPRGSWRVGQIGGVDVLVNSSWLLIAGFIAVLLAPQVEQVEPGLGGWAYVAGLAFAILLYLSVLLHEVSHALMALHFKIPVRSITLHFLGGVTEMKGEPDTPRREFAVSVVGPLTSLAVGGIFLLIGRVVQTGLLGLAVDGLTWANLVVGVLNLVPGLPLDGGRVLRAAVWKLTRDPHKATLVAGWGGRIVAGLALLYPMLLSSLTGVAPTLSDYVMAIVIAAFLWSGASASIASAQVRRRLPVLRARTLARRTVSVPQDVPLSEAVRRAQGAAAGGIVTVDVDGRPAGIVSESALLATPEDRRPWMPVSAVARSLEGGLLLGADVSGEDLILAMQRTPAAEYLLIEEDGAVYGLLSTQDVDRAFRAAR